MWPLIAPGGNARRFARPLHFVCLKLYFALPSVVNSAEVEPCYLTQIGVSDAVAGARNACRGLAKCKGKTAQVDVNRAPVK